MAETHWTPKDVLEQAINWLCDQPKWTRSKVDDALFHELTEEQKLKKLKNIIAQHKRQPRALMGWIEEALEQLKKSPDPAK